MSEIPKLIVIEGPTASGKTALGIALAKHFGTVVVSADSRQFYKETSIGTAKPTVAEQDGITHFFVDSHSIHDSVTSARFEQEALAVLEQEFQKHEVILLVGGSGMFIDALCYGLDNIPHDAAIKAALNHEFEHGGIAPLLAELKLADPVYYDRVDQQNPLRIIRALEVIRLTGKPFSDFHAFKPQQRSFEIIKFVIDLPREVLYDRINRRVDAMLEQGLLAEAHALYADRHLQSLNTVGYTELFDFFDGKTDLAEATEHIKRNTRRYAKRQLTWFRRDEKAIWMQENECGQQVKFILSHL